MGVNRHLDGGEKPGEAEEKETKIRREEACQNTTEKFREEGQDLRYGTPAGTELREFISIIT